MQATEINALACQLPAEHEVPLSVWSCPELAHEAITAGIVESISASAVRRRLAEDAIKPRQHQSWIFIRDPDFRIKASRGLDLYARIWEGSPLGPDEYVISSDEKTSVQARCRCHPTLPPGKARRMRVNHDYDRGGALAYLAAYDVHHAQGFGQCAPSHRDRAVHGPGRTPHDPTALPQRQTVFWIVDNGSSHRSKAAIDRLAKRFPNAVMVHTPVHTPVHASWLNQGEIYFSITQRKVVSPNDFTTLDQVEQRLADFEQRYNATARPFQWNSPQPTSMTCSPGSTNTNSQPPEHHPPGRVINPRRTSGDGFLAIFDR